MRERTIFLEFTCPARINLTSLDIVPVAILCWTFCDARNNQLNSLGAEWHKGKQSIRVFILEAPIHKTRD